MCSLSTTGIRDRSYKYLTSTERRARKSNERRPWRRNREQQRRLIVIRDAFATGWLPLVRKGVASPTFTTLALSRGEEIIVRVTLFLGVVKLVVKSGVSIYTYIAHADARFALCVSCSTFFKRLYRVAPLSHREKKLRSSPPQKRFGQF